MSDGAVETSGLARLRELEAIAAGRDRGEALARIHARGLLTARQRVDALLDEGSDMPFGRFVHNGRRADAERTIGDGSLFGFGTIDGREVAYVATDVSVKGGSGGASMRRRVNGHARLVEKAALPLVYLSQAGGARISDVISSRFAGFYGSGIGVRHALGRRGLVVCAVLGNYYAPWKVAECDFGVMTETANFSFTSPAVLRAATGQQLSATDLGGATVHAERTGQIDAVAVDDREAIALVRRAFSYLPGNAFESPPVVRCGDPPERTDEALRTLVPERQNRAFDVRKVIQRVVDHDSFFETLPRFGRSLVGGFARMDGYPVVILASQGLHEAGSITVDSARKMRRLLTLCQEFHLPLVTFQDVPGVLTAAEQECRRLLYETYHLAVARLQPDVPKVTVILRKAYGYGYFAFGGGDPEGYTVAWPSARIAFTGPEPAVRVIHRRELEAASDPAAIVAERTAQFDALSDPDDAVRLGYVDAIIDPAQTRPVVVRLLAAARREVRR